MALGVVLGYLVSLVLLSAFLIWEYQYIQLHNDQTANAWGPVGSPGYREELSMRLMLVFSTMPAAVGGAVTGWIGFSRPVRTAVFTALLYSLLGPMVAFDFEGPEAEYVQMFSLEYLRELRPIGELYAKVLSLALLFAVPPAALAGYLRRQRG